MLYFLLAGSRKCIACFSKDNEICHCKGEDVYKYSKNFVSLVLMVKWSEIENTRLNRPSQYIQEGINIVMKLRIPFVRINMLGNTPHS